MTCLHFYYKINMIFSERFESFVEGTHFQDEIWFLLINGSLKIKIKWFFTLGEKASGIGFSCPWTCSNYSLAGEMLWTPRWDSCERAN